MGSGAPGGPGAGGKVAVNRADCNATVVDRCFPPNYLMVAFRYAEPRGFQAPPSASRHNQSSASLQLRNSACRLLLEFTVICVTILAATSCAGTRHGNGVRPIEGCGDATWVPSFTTTYKIPDGSVLRYVSTAATDDNATFTGMVVPWENARPVLATPVIVGRFRDNSLGLPDLSPTAAYPRIVSLQDGRQRLIWSQPDDTATGWHDPFHRSMKSLWHSTYSHGAGWSEPVELVRDAIRIDWGELGGSLTQTPNSDVHLVSVSGDIAAGWIIHVFVPSRGNARVQRIPLTQLKAPFTAVHVAGDSILIAYVVGNPRESPPVHRIQLVSSDDGGLSWQHLDTPELTAIPEARTLNFARTPDGRIHLLFGRTAPRSVWVEHYTHFSSSDGGRTWQFRNDMAVPAGAQDPQLESDSCGRLHLAFKDVNSRRSALLYSHWTDGKWSEPAELMPGLPIMYAAMSRTGSTLQIVVTTSTSDTTANLMMTQLRTP